MSKKKQPEHVPRSDLLVMAMQRVQSKFSLWKVTLIPLGGWGRGGEGGEGCLSA